VEVQGAGEHGTFDRTALDRLVQLAESGIGILLAEQTRA
jgi:ribonuclease PH